MGCRLIKDSICRSEEIDALTWFEEVLFYRLIATCDDYGRYDGRAKIIKGNCFPLKDITEKDIDKALGKLSAVGLIWVYTLQGKPYLQLVTWEKHQRTRNQKSKYPEYSAECELLTFDGKWKPAAEDEQERALKYAQEIAEAKKEKEAPKTAKTRDGQQPQEEPVISITLNTGEEYPVTQSYITELAGCIRQWISCKSYGL